MHLPFAICKATKTSSLHSHGTKASSLQVASSFEVVQVLLDKGVEEGKILFLSLIAAPEGVHKICGQYPRVKVVTTEIDEGIASDFQVIPGNASLVACFVQHVWLACDQQGCATLQGLVSLGTGTFATDLCPDGRKVRPQSYH